MPGPCVLKQSTYSAFSRENMSGISCCNGFHTLSLQYHPLKPFLFSGLPTKFGLAPKKHVIDGQVSVSSIWRLVNRGLNTQGSTVSLVVHKWGPTPKGHPKSIGGLPSLTHAQNGCESLWVPDPMDIRQRSGFMSNHFLGFFGTSTIHGRISSSNIKKEGSAIFGSPGLGPH